MTRKQIAHHCYKILKRDGKCRGDNDLEVWKAIAETDDNSLEEFLYSHIDLEDDNELELRNTEPKI